MALAVVQSKSQINGFSAPPAPTLGSAPTAGNLVIFFLHCNILSASITVDTTKWTKFCDVQSGTQQYGMGLYRYVQGGDSATLPAPWSLGTTYSAYDIFEISGVTGTFATDAPLTPATNVATSSTGSLTAGPTTTTSANALALVGYGHYNGSSDPTLSAGWTRDEVGHNAGNYGSDAGGHQAIASSGTAVSVTATDGQTNNPHDIMMLILELAASSETGTATLGFGPHAFSASGKDSHSGTGGLAFGPHAFVAQSDDVTAGGILRFGPHAFSASGAASHTGTAGLAFGPHHFSASGVARHTASGSLAFGPVSIYALGARLAPAGSSTAAGLSDILQQKLQPLTWNQPITDPRTGFPSQEFERKWLRNIAIFNAQLGINKAIVTKPYVDSQDTASLGAAQTYTDTTLASRILSGSRLVAALPATPLLNTRALVTDSTQTLAAGLGTAVVGGGANTVPVYYDGAWKIG